MQLRLQVGLHPTCLHQSLPSWTGRLINPQGSTSLCQATIPLILNNASGQFYHAASLNSRPEDRGHREQRWGWGSKQRPSRGQIQTELAWQTQFSSSQH